jgi:hypothetical protein
MPNYGNSNYWDQRYNEQAGTTFDWLEDYSSLKDLIKRFCPDKATCRILNIGCGNGII